MANNINAEVMNELLYYDESSPSGLSWKIKVGRGDKLRVPGDMAGHTFTSRRKNYKSWVIGVQGKLYQAHRVVYVLVNGYLDSSLEIDHKDGNALNNRIENLRAVPHSVNTRNTKMRIQNSSGVTGVRYDSFKDRYCADYSDTTGKHHSKSFSCNKYGSILAFELACRYRQEKIVELNIELGTEGYSERHGET